MREDVRVEVLQFAADIGGLLAVEIEISLRSIGVAAAVIPFEHAERYQCIEEVAGTALVDFDALRKRVKIKGPISERREYAKLSRTQQSLGSSERKAELDDSV